MESEAFQCLKNKERILILNHFPLNPTQVNSSGKLVNCWWILPVRRQEAVGTQKKAMRMRHIWLLLHCGEIQHFNGDDDTIPVF
mmetsp:Transcript_9059/g.12551  ORF Transcript_9059/g.12551 Transcript_9059/m.12551 type:complete len:84 (-) Transcript_9059:163-414(-)